MGNLLQWKVAEMTQPSRRLAGLRAMQTNQPYFTDASGNAITQIQAGGAYNFTVAGWEGKQVYLIMSKDGQQVYNALFSVPMGLYTSTSDNIGSWIADVYDPVSGAPLGQATLAILPAGGAGGTPGPGGTTTPPGPTGTPSGVPGVFSGMSTGTLLALAAGAFILLSGKKKLL